MVMNEQQIPARAICLFDVVVLTCSREPVRVEKIGAQASKKEVNK